MAKRKVIIIAGPTASGKSDLAVELALKIDGEIISSDSRQIYAGLDIGSGKITEDEMRRVVHYGLGYAEPMDKFTAANWLDYAETKIKEIIEKNKTPIIVGGTGLYIDALIYGIEDKPAPDHALRSKLSTLSIKELQQIIITKCVESKSDYYKNLNNSEKNNKERLIRKIETLDFEIEKFENESKCVDKENNSKRKIRSDYEFEFIILERDKEDLKNRIELRLDKRLEVGKDRVSPLINEVENIIRNYNNSDEIKSWLFKLGLEYKFVTLYLENKISYEDMILEIRIESFKYAKRQITWNKKYKDMRKFDITNL